MRITLSHLEGYSFSAGIRGHRLLMDAKPPVGRDTAPTPKEMLLASILGCSGMDVVGHLKKHRVTTKRFAVTGDATARDEHPRIFPRIDLAFEFEGDELPQAVLEEAVKESLTKYCGVSAMVNAVSPIFYTVVVNGTTVATGQAAF